MKITNVTLTLFRWENLPEAKYMGGAGSAGREVQMGLVTITTDEGIEGHSFLGASMRGANLDGVSLIDKLKPCLIGQNPLERERLYREMWRRNRHTTLRCIGAIDVALWDLGGKVANLPIHAMLGTFRNSIPAYASSPTHTEIAPYIDESQEIKAKGFAAYKIHPPTPWDRDIKCCEAVRKAVGDDYTVMLDAAWGYNYKNALKVGRAIEELSYDWYEDPLDADDITQYPKLREKLDIPIIATEYSWGSLQAYAPWILMNATDALRGDVAVKGGITPCIKAAHLAEAFGMNYEVHHGGNSVNNWANLHIIMAIRNTEYFEVILPDGAQKYGVIDDLEIDKNGHVQAPTGPGLGCNIDFDLIKAKTVSLLT
ncbi:MAG: enolase C-terminal domain-like protein [Rhodospirillales bacterium]|jgi:L-alanine-DL-glutamate epimerase-like enolase superfamily enzyme